MITVQFRPDEQAVFDELRKRSEMSAEAQIRHMLRWYQLIDAAQRDGYAITRTKEGVNESLTGLDLPMKGNIEVRS